MENEMISVVIPVYCVEQYIDRCIRSILNQTYGNFEIILVDDGSPDNSGALCDAFAKMDERVKAYHKSNGGPSEARNFGVAQARGSYIAFVDSDDYLSPEYLEYLHHLIKKYDADVSVCCRVKADSDSVTFGSDESLLEERLMNGMEASKELMGDLYVELVTVWGKLYRSEIVKKYPYEVGRFHEDEATTCKYYYEAKKVCMGNRCLYAYYQNPDSFMHTKGNTLNTDAIWAMEHRALFYEEKNEKTLADLAWHRLFKYYVWDSKNNAGRCDEYAKGFKTGKQLSKRVRFEVDLYNASQWAYWKYRRLTSLGEHFKTKRKASGKKRSSKDS